MLSVIYVLTKIYYANHEVGNWCYLLVKHPISSRLMIRDPKWKPRRHFQSKCKLSPRKCFTYISWLQVARLPSVCIWEIMQRHPISSRLIMNDPNWQPRWSFKKWYNGIRSIRDEPSHTLIGQKMCSAWFYSLCKIRGLSVKYLQIVAHFKWRVMFERIIRVRISNENEFILVGFYEQFTTMFGTAHGFHIVSCWKNSMETLLTDISLHFNYGGAVRAVIFGDMISLHQEHESNHL